MIRIVGQLLLTVAFAAWAWLLATAPLTGDGMARNGSADAARPASQPDVARGRAAGQGTAASTASANTPEGGAFGPSAEVGRSLAARAPQTLARPVFFPDRQMPTAAKPATVAVKPAVPPVPDRPLRSAAGLEVQGIFVTGGERKALIGGGDKRSEWVGAGDTIQDWTVRAIEPSAVVLAQGGQSVTLPLYPPPR